jgi:hypothetical protein
LRAFVRTQIRRSPGSQKVESRSRILSQSGWQKSRGYLGPLWSQEGITLLNARVAHEMWWCLSQKCEPLIKRLISEIVTGSLDLLTTTASILRDARTLIRGPCMRFSRQLEIPICNESEIVNHRLDRLCPHNDGRRSHRMRTRCSCPCFQEHDRATFHLSGSPMHTAPKCRLEG